MSGSSAATDGLRSRLRGLLGNCGGLNLRGARYAARFADPISEEERVAICHALILPNGTRKTTARSRAGELLSSALTSGALSPPPGARVLEVGASIGLDASTNAEVIGGHTSVAQYVLGDQFTELLVDRKRGRVFDQDGVLLQLGLGPAFFSVQFEHLYQVQRLWTVPQRLLAAGATRLVEYNPDREYERVQLFHPELRVNRPDSIFEGRRIDVFGPISGEFDIIVCLHLLVDRYFSRAQIRRGIENLQASLADGGALVVGAAECADVITRHGDSFTTRRMDSGRT